ncbi:MAG: hypothetical protein ISS36_01945 [Candidatus Aenigmarchaeota archaeon]|nr:hypothetical protein [Candidatus Aenigmarchaeota archaeon]
MKHFKGITPVISIIILLLITVAIAGAAFTFLGGYLGAYTEKAFIITPGGAFCDEVAGKNTISVIVQNTGTTEIKTTDWVVAEIDGYDLITALKITADLPSGSSKKIINTLNTGDAEWSSGAHILRLGTSSTVLTERVVCP